MAYRITTNWNDGTVTTTERVTFDVATNFARRNRDIANVLSVVIDSASAPEGKTKTHDLGAGWYANLTRHYDGQETLTISNADLGLRSNLDANSTARLREIFQYVAASEAEAHANSVLDDVAASFTA